MPDATAVLLRPVPPRTLDEIVELGLQALNQEIQRLSEEPELSTWQGKQLCDYVSTVLGVDRNHRERALSKHLQKMSDEQLDELLAKHAPEIVQLIREKRPELLLPPAQAS